MRYLKQRNRYSCGPIAILNALKWAGKKVSYNSHFERIKKLSKCRIDGSVFNEMVRAVENYKSVFVVKKSYYVDISTLDFYIKEGASIILEYYYKDTAEEDGYIGHSVFIPGKWKKYFLVVNNYQKGPALQLCDRRELKNMIKRKSTFGDDYTKAIILFRKDDYI